MGLELFFTQPIQIDNLQDFRALAKLRQTLNSF